MYRIKVGCQLSYLTQARVPAVLIVKPPPQTALTVVREQLDIGDATAAGEYIDGFGNRCQRVTLAAGATTVRYEAIVTVPPEPDAVCPEARQVLPEALPSHLLRYTLPSRYAETDKLLGFAWEAFGRLPE